MAEVGSIRWQLELLFWTSLGAAFGLICVTPYVILHPIKSYRDIKEVWELYHGSDSD